jgi:hypothetical protein
MAKRRKVGNVLALYLLSLLAQQPMYPYEMAQTLRERGKEKSFPINWVHRGGGHGPRGPATRADHLPDHRGRPG